MTVAMDITPPRPTPSPLSTPEPEPESQPDKPPPEPAANIFTSAPLALKSVLSHRHRTTFPTPTSITDEITWWFRYLQNHLTDDIDLALAPYWSADVCYRPVIAPWVYGDVKAKKQNAVDAILWSLETLNRVKSEPREDKEWQEREEQNCLNLLETAHREWDAVESEVVGLLVWKRRWVEGLIRAVDGEGQRGVVDGRNWHAGKGTVAWKERGREEGVVRTPLTPEEEEGHRTSLTDRADRGEGIINPNRASSTNAPPTGSVSSVEIDLNKTGYAQTPAAGDVTQPPSPLSPGAEPVSSELSDLCSSSSLSDIVMSSPTAEIQRRQRSKIPEPSKNGVINNDSALPGDESLTSLFDLSSVLSPENTEDHDTSGTRRKATSSTQVKGKVKRVKWAKDMHQMIKLLDHLAPQCASSTKDTPLRPCRVLQSQDAHTSAADHAEFDRYTTPQHPTAADEPVRTTRSETAQASHTAIDLTLSLPPTTTQAAKRPAYQRRQRKGAREVTPTLEQEPTPPDSQDTPYRNLRTRTVHNYDEITRRPRKTGIITTVTPSQPVQVPESSPLSFTTAMETSSPMMARMEPPAMVRIGGEQEVEGSIGDEDSPGRRLRAGEWTSRVAERARGWRLRERERGVEGNDEMYEDEEENSSEEEISFVGM